MPKKSARSTPSEKRKPAGQKGKPGERRKGEDPQLDTFIKKAETDPSYRKLETEEPDLDDVVEESLDEGEKWDTDLDDASSGEDRF